MQKTILLKAGLVIALIFCGLNEVSAGWFICHIYKGRIGEKQAMVSIQIEKKYSTNEKDWLNVYGVYTDNNHKTPVPLSGRFDPKRNEIIISQRGDGTDSLLYWHMQMTGKSLTGTRSLNQKDSERIALKEVASLIDTAYHSKLETLGVDILQDVSLDKYLLVGVYSIRAYTDAAMDRLELVDKETSKVYQVIDLSAVDFPAGNLMTNIFKNVEIRPTARSTDFADLTIWCRVGKHGGYVTAVYDAELGKYTIDPEAKKDDFPQK